MTPREISNMRDAAMRVGKIAERFASDSTPYVIIRDAERRLYEVARHFEGRNLEQPAALTGTTPEAAGYQQPQVLREGE